MITNLLTNIIADKIVNTFFDALTYNMLQYNNPRLIIPGHVMSRYAQVSPLIGSSRMYSYITFASLSKMSLTK